MLEAECKPTMQPQRRLNPTLKEVVKKEVLKLLDAGCVLKRCKETNLLLNWEKCHFMVREGIVLGHKVSKKGIKVDRAKVEIIEKLPPPTSTKGAFNLLKEKLTSVPVIVAPNWELPFELMCDARDYVVGAVLGQRRALIVAPCEMWMHLAVLRASERKPFVARLTAPAVQLDESSLLMFGGLVDLDPWEPQQPLEELETLDLLL
ncbi:uncharacterized protein LOC116204376 [Punica granatum]|uniref:Uncharacterized protein LOC116204376 n=1 Tax=Punica granatum TaxID=22663 RepID=A0A6P8D5E0_PUNGR|nr:uncharacterized protein LOC116204376 [Punica granatum]